MNYMRFSGFITAFVLGMFLFLSLPVGVEAAVLKFDNATSTVAAGETITVQVRVDPKTDQIAGADVYILYDANLLEPQTVTQDTYFPIVTNNIQSGKVYISAVVEDATQYKTGEGTIARVTFRALQAGTATLRYDCDLTRNDSSKVVKNDINATNVIECNALGTQVVTITGSGTGTGTGTTTTTTTTGTSSLPAGTTYGATTQLPASGIIDTIAKFSIPGLALLVLGITLRLFARNSM